jgi:pimeloyl-ACP methyl ester carboxylesterase
MIIWAALGALAVFLIVFFLFSFINFSRDLNDARSRMAGIPTEVYASKYGDIEYCLVGTGPTVLVSHGVTGGIDQGMLITGKFISSVDSYRFLYVSRFGYMKSSLPNDASARVQAAAYIELIDHLGIDQVYIFGNSAGGTSTLWFAIDYPERTKGLILLSSAVPAVKPVKMAPGLIFKNDFLYWAIVKAAPNMLIGFLLPKEILVTLTEKEKADLIKDVYLAGLPISERSDGIIFDNGISTPSVNHIPLEQIKVPTLILQSIDDPHEQEGGNNLAERIDSSEYIKLTGGHFLMREEKRVQTEIAEFINNHR